MTSRVIVAVLALVAASTPACAQTQKRQPTSPAAAASARPDGGPLRDAATLSVFVDLPPDAVLTSPMRISGTADSRFFNEGVFPIRLLGANGCVLGEAPAMPGGDWMAPGQVPFEATIAFEAAPGTAAVLVFEEDMLGEDPLAPLDVRMLVTIAGERDPDQANPDPADCAATRDP